MKSDSIAAIAAALSKAQAEIKPAIMDKTNPFLKNKYADLGSVIEASRAPLSKNGLSFVQLVGGDGSTVTVTTMLMHSSGEWISSETSLPVGDEKGRSLAQGVGSIITYLRRYSLSAMLGIYADEDTDGNQQRERQQQRKQSAPEEPYQEPEEIGDPSDELLAAMNTTNSQGVRYGDMNTAGLSKMAQNISELLKNQALEADKRAELERKHAAATLILRSRN